MKKIQSSKINGDICNDYAFRIVEMLREKDIDAWVYGTGGHFYAIAHISGEPDLFVIDGYPQGAGPEGVKLMKRLGGKGYIVAPFHLVDDFYNGTVLSEKEYTVLNRVRMQNREERMRDSAKQKIEPRAGTEDEPSSDTGTPMKQGTGEVNPTPPLKLSSESLTEQATNDEVIRILTALASFGHGTNNATNVSALLQWIITETSLVKLGLGDSHGDLRLFLERIQARCEILASLYAEAREEIRQPKLDSEAIISWKEKAFLIRDRIAEDRKNLESALSEDPQQYFDDKGIRRTQKAVELLHELESILDDRFSLIEGKTSDDVFSLNDIFDNIFNELWETRTGHVKKSHFELRVPDEHIWVRGNRRSITSAICNLAANGLNVAANYRSADDAKVVIEVKREGGEIVITVQDNGPGIAPEKLKDIWTPFYSTTGGGIGLTEAKLIAEDHGGSISVKSVSAEEVEDSAQESGTTFTIRVARSMEHGARSEERRTPREDNPFIYGMLEAKGVALNFRNKLFSALVSKKVVLAFEDGIGEGDSAMILDVFEKIKREVERLKEAETDKTQKLKYERFLRNLTIITASSEKLPEEVSAHFDKNTEVFVFARKSEREKLEEIEPKVHSTYIDETEYKWDTYYPLPEIVTIALSQYLDSSTLDNVSDTLKSLNIKSTIDDFGALIFTLLPNAKVYDRPGLIKKHAATKRALIAV